MAACLSNVVNTTAPLLATLGLSISDGVAPVGSPRTVDWKIVASRGAASAEMRGATRVVETAIDATRTQTSRETADP